MIRRLFRVVIRLGLVGGAGFAAFKFVQARRAAPAGMPSGDMSVMPKRSETPLVAPNMLKDVSLHKSEDADEAPEANGQVQVAAEPVTDEPAPEPEPEPESESESEREREPAPSSGDWVDPDGTVCPPAHPVKAKLASGIYHLPGMTAYERTTPDRCYRDEDAAEADGLRKAKR